MKPSLNVHLQALGKLGNFKVVCAPLQDTGGKIVLRSEEFPLASTAADALTGKYLRILPVTDEIFSSLDYFIKRSFEEFDICFICVEFFIHTGK